MSLFIVLRPHNIAIIEELVVFITSLFKEQSTMFCTVGVYNDLGQDWRNYAVAVSPGGHW